MKSLKKNYKSLKDKLKLSEVKEVLDEIPLGKVLVVVGAILSFVALFIVILSIVVMFAKKLDSKSEVSSIEVPHGYIEKQINGHMVIENDQIQGIQINSLYVPDKYFLESWLIYYKDFGITCMRETNGKGSSNHCWGEEETPISIKNKLGEY